MTDEIPVPLNKDTETPQDVPVVEYPDPVEVNANALDLKEPRLHVFRQAGKNGEGDVIGVYLSEKDEELKHVGHAVAMLDAEEPSNAIVHINYCKTNDFKSGLAAADNIPPEAKSLTEHGDVLNALELDENYKDKGIGSTFWTAAMEVLHRQGIKNVQIVGDVTIGQKSPLATFYTHHGAEVDAAGNITVDLEKFVTENKDSIDRIFS